MNTRVPGFTPERIALWLPPLEPSSIGWNVGWSFLPTSKTPGLPSSVTIATVGTRVLAAVRPV